MSAALDMRVLQGGFPANHRFAVSVTHGLHALRGARSPSELVNKTKIKLGLQPFPLLRRLRRVLRAKVSTLIITARTPRDARRTARLQR